nr:uncharacterized protein LOC109184184 [Ipomoea batatas]
MSDTDSQDVSRDYEGEFPVASPSGSRTRSMGPHAGGSSSRSKVSVRAADFDGDEAESGLREQGAGAEALSYGRGKSPRRVVEALSTQYQSLSPVSRATHLASLPRPETLPPPRPHPPVLPSSSAPERPVLTYSPRPSVSEPPPLSEVRLAPLDDEDVRKHQCLLTHSELEEISSLLKGRTKALREAVIKISTKSYEYSIFRSPEAYAAANLQAPDYTQKEKYIPEKAGVAATRPTLAPGQSGKGMVLERSFAVAPAGPKKTRKKVALGSLKLTADPPEATGATASTAVPPAAATVGGFEPDLQMSRPLRRRGKEKAADSEVEIVAPAKRPKRPSPPGSTPILDALRDGGEQTSTLLEKIRTMVPDRDHIRSLATDQVGEHIAQDILRGVYAALTESLSDHDLAAILEVMPDDVADPGPNPFTSSSASAGADAGSANEAPGGGALKK